MFKKGIFAIAAISGLAYVLTKLYYDIWNKGWLEAAILPEEDYLWVEL